MGFSQASLESLYGLFFFPYNFEVRMGCILSELLFIKPLVESYQFFDLVDLTEDV